jgi:hypothetical protein
MCVKLILWYTKIAFGASKWAGFSTRFQQMGDSETTAWEDWPRGFIQEDCNGWCPGFQSAIVC